MRRSWSKAAQCIGRAGIHAAVRSRFTKESIMFFAPVVRTRAASPAFRSYDRSFERFIDEAFFSNTARGVKVEQDDKAWTVTFDMPGVAREELSINIEGGVVRIETKEAAKRPFKAAYELPQDIDAQASAAKLENGVLTLTLVKQVPVSHARQIEVK
jgi:HSP20 family molecular chaperone IbpA